MSEVKAIMSKMQESFDAEAADEMDAVLQFNLEEGEQFYAVVSGAKLELAEGCKDDATVTLAMAEDTLVDILEGDADGMTCFMTGQLQVEGDMMLAGQITELFPA